LYEVNHPNLCSLWQPGVRNVAVEELQALQQMLPHVTNVHVFHWKAGGQERQPLVDGTANWCRYLEVRRRNGRDRCVLIEFVRGDESAMFLQDARTLCEWLQQNP
jgi:3-dehydroshikimate dehydratase